MNILTGLTVKKIDINKPTTPMKFEILKVMIVTFIFAIFVCYYEKIPLRKFKFNKAMCGKNRLEFEFLILKKHLLTN